MSKKTTQELRVIEDNDRYRVLSGEHLPDDQAAHALALHFKKKFQRNIQVETGRYVALKNIRIEYYRATDARVQQLVERIGRLPQRMTSANDIRTLLPYAVSGRRVYVSEDAFMSIGAEQKRDFIETKLRPWLVELGINCQMAPRVHLIPNRPV